MSDLNEEWVQSIIKLGLIEAKKGLLASIGTEAYSNESTEWLATLVREYTEFESLLRDEKATAKLAAEIVKASRK